MNVSQLFQQIAKRPPTLDDLIGVYDGYRWHGRTTSRPWCSHKYVDMDGLDFAALLAIPLTDFRTDLGAGGWANRVEIYPEEGAINGVVVCSDCLGDTIIYITDHSDTDEFVWDLVAPARLTATQLAHYRAIGLRVDAPMDIAKAVANDWAHLLML
jgi:hypothetical protein